MDTSNLGNPKTASELLFEEYLETNGYPNWQHEASMDGRSTTPDYRLEFEGSSYFFEVKEFETKPPGEGFGAFDPYAPLREKINRATRQFKHYKEFSCSVVLANPQAAFVMFDNWAIMGAMLGGVGFRVALGRPIGPDNPVEKVFTKGGKLVDNRRGQPQNTTISSVIVLGTYPLRLNLIRIEIAKREKELDRSLSVEEALAYYEATPDSPDLRIVRVIVYENPFARIPLSQNLFVGPYDKRYGEADGDMRRIFAGKGIREMEASLGE